MVGNSLSKILTALLWLSLLLQTTSAVAARGDSNIHPLSVSNETKAAMAKYSLKAYEDGDPAHAVGALLFTPKPRGAGPLPMVVYIPGSGEIGEVARQFRQRAIFERVTSAAFQKKHPCYLLAISPPKDAHTLMGGMPGRPSAMQRAIHGFIRELAGRQRRPKVDLRRIYLTGFSYGGNGAYALAQHYPEAYAAVVPIAALPPLPEYFSGEHPGSWWHFYNEGDYARHGLDASDLERYARMVNAAGGDFRVGAYPSAGHDAWTKAWREDVVWDWVFSKSLGGAARPGAGNAGRPGPASVALAGVRCTASVPGADRACGPERVADGLDATGYLPARPFTRDDWWQAEFAGPVCGRFRLHSGDGRGGLMLKSGYVEISGDGRRWTAAGTFSAKTGTCDFELRKDTRFVRVRSRSPCPVAFRLRRLSAASDGRR